jgi:hypothetical protein
MTSENDHPRTPRLRLNRQKHNLICATVGHKYKLYRACLEDQQRLRNCPNECETCHMLRESFHQSAVPATGKIYGPCHGYVVDHVIALKRGGADAPYNMQWQTTQAAKAKDRTE